MGVTTKAAAGARTFKQQAPVCAGQVEATAVSYMTAGQHKCRHQSRAVQSGTVMLGIQLTSWACLDSFHVPNGLNPLHNTTPNRQAATHSPAVRAHTHTGHVHPCKSWTLMPKMHTLRLSCLLRAVDRAPSAPMHTQTSRAQHDTTHNL